MGSSGQTDIVCCKRLYVVGFLLKNPCNKFWVDNLSSRLL